MIRTPHMEHEFAERQDAALAALDQEADDLRARIKRHEDRPGDTEPDQWDDWERCTARLEEIAKEREEIESTTFEEDYASHQEDDGC
jgi:hypothetical protein